MSTSPSHPTLRLLGDPAVRLPDGSVRALERRAAGLLALVALEPGVTRARAAALLWPHSDDSRKALRQQLLRFRKLFDAALVQGDDVLRLDDGVGTDLAAGSEPLLGALSFDDCDDFADWLAGQRAARRGAQVEPLQQALAQAETQRDFEQALALAEQLLAIEPDSEAHQRTVIRLHYLRGDLAQAQAGYERLKRRLRTKFGTAPSAESEALARLLRSAREAGGALAKATATAVSVQTPAALLRPPRLVGRVRELEALHAAWQAQRAVLLLGEPGLGKSRLLAEFAQAELENGRRVLTVQARPGDAGVPYALLARLLRRVLERCSVDLAGSNRSELARLLPELAPDAPPQADGQRLLLQRSIEALLAPAVLDGAPLHGLLIDDLHFADDASVEMLQSLVAAPTLAHLRWALAQRPGEGGAAATALRRELQEADLLVVLPLPALTAHELSDLLASLQLAELDVDALAAALARHTGGNPLYALETLKAGFGSGALRSGRLPAPASVGALIERRLEQLPERALDIARIAAVAGVDFSVPLAEQVTGLRALSLAGAWRELESAQILRGSAFAHDLVQDAVLRGVPDAIAGHLHGEIAAWLQQRSGEPARVAQHWLAAGRDAEAVEALLAACERARAAGLDVERGELLLKAAAACDRLGQPDRAFDLTFEAADAISLAVPVHRFEPVAADLARRAVNDAQRAAALLCGIHVLIERDEAVAVTLAPALQALEAARRAGRRDLEAELLFVLARNELFSGNAEAACDLVGQAIDLLQQTSKRARYADKLMTFANVQAAVGRVAQALRTIGHCGEELRELKLHHMLPPQRSAAAALAVVAGDSQLARRMLAEVDSPELQAIVMNDGHAGDLLAESTLDATRLGDLHVALLHHGRWRASMQLIGNEFKRQCVEVALMSELGRYDRAWPHVPALRERWRSGIYFAVVAYGAWLQHSARDAARFWSETDDLKTALPRFGVRCELVARTAVHAPVERVLAEIDRLLDIARPNGGFGAAVSLLAARAVVLARAGRLGEAAATAADCDSLAADHCDLVGPVWVALNCAEAFARAGVHDRARACLQRGAARAREIAALLPGEYRASYLQRNPVVRAVLEAERHCSAQGAGADWTRVAGIVAGASIAQAWIGGPAQ